MVVGLLLFFATEHLTTPECCMLHKKRPCQGREGRQDAYFGGVLDWRN